MRKWEIMCVIRQIWNYFTSNCYSIYDSPLINNHPLSRNMAGDENI